MWHVTDFWPVEYVRRDVHKSLLGSPKNLLQDLLLPYPSVSWPGAGHLVKESEALSTRWYNHQSEDAWIPVSLCGHKLSPSIELLREGGINLYCAKPLRDGAAVTAFTPLTNISSCCSGSHLSLQHHLLFLSYLSMMQGTNWPR